MADTDQNKKFDVALEELEDVIQQLETGELPLEEALTAFEKGVGLVKYCNLKLTEAGKKVELLIRDKEGRLDLKSFEVTETLEENED